MAVVHSSNLCEEFPMNGGHGPHSYFNNSFYQREAVDAVKEVIHEAIEGSLEINIISSSPNKTFHITDMGCSSGPNTFVAVENIIEAIQKKLIKSQGGSVVVAFQVYFNDHVSNDFNTLFSSLPPDRKYCAMGVPGSFHGRLFPDLSLHIVHSSYALQWLSRVPVDKSWNKGRIHYSSSGDEVVKAYADQFGNDIDKFLCCRAEEIVPGGLILITLPCRLNGTPHSQIFSNVAYDLLGSCLMDLAKKGKLSEEKVNSFNIPIYFTSPKEIEEAVERNGCFNVERVICIPQKKSEESIPKKAKAICHHIRAGFEALLKDHFGAEIFMDQLFDNYVKQLENLITVFQFGLPFSLFLILKRKSNV